MEFRNSLLQYKSPPSVPILGQINPVHAPSHFLSIHFNIILPSRPRYSKRSLSLRFPHWKLARTYRISHMCYMPSQPFSSWIGHPNNNWWTVQLIKPFLMQPSPFPRYLVPLRLKYLSQHPTLEHSRSCTVRKLPFRIMPVVDTSIVSAHGKLNYQNHKYK